MADKAIIIRDGWVHPDEGICTVVAGRRDGYVHFYARQRSPAISISLAAWLQIVQSVRLAIQYPETPSRRFEIGGAFPLAHGGATAVCVIHVLSDKHIVVFERDLHQEMDPVLRLGFADALAINALWPPPGDAADNRTISQERYMALKIIFNSTKPVPGLAQEWAILGQIIAEIEGE